MRLHVYLWCMCWTGYMWILWYVSIQLPQPHLWRIVSCAHCFSLRPLLIQSCWRFGKHILTTKCTFYSLFPCPEPIPCATNVITWPYFNLSPTYPKISLLPLVSRLNIKPTMLVYYDLWSRTIIINVFILSYVT